MRLLDELDRRAVTISVAGAALIATAAFWADYDVEHLFLPSGGLPSAPWTLVTSCLLHADVLHLVFNLYWVWIFGGVIEERLGRLATAGLFLLLMAAPAAAEYAFFDGGIGLSGLGYGLFGLLWALGRRDPGYRVVDEGVVKIFVGWFFLCIVLTLTGTWRIANVAHGAGGVLGYLTGRVLGTPANARRSAALQLVGALVAVLLLASVARPWVNMGDGRLQELRWRAGEAYDAGDYEAAIAHYRELVELEPEDEVTLAFFARTLGYAGRAEEGLAVADRALALHPDSAELHGARGALLGATGRTEEALAALERTLELEPEDTWAHVRRARYLATLDRAEEAIPALERLVQRDPQAVNAWGQLGVCLGNVGRFDEAVRALENGLVLAPEDPWLLNNLGWCQWEVGRKAESLETLAHAVEVDPDPVWALGTRALYLVELGRLEEAASDYGRALELDPTDSRALRARRQGRAAALRSSR